MMSTRITRSRRTPSLEVLETRTHGRDGSADGGGTTVPRGVEQRRANPAAYGVAIGVDLSGVAPSQPLAFNPYLINEGANRTRST